MATSKTTNDQRDIVMSFIEELGGDVATKVATFLSNDEEITDEELASKTDLKLNIVRKILYKLYDNHLASYRRIRDTNTGWFVYFWKLEPDRVNDLLQRRRQSVLKILRQRLDYEKENMFFKCASNGCSRYTFDQAIEHSFKCPNCHLALQNLPNDDTIKSLEEKILELESNL